MKKKIIIIMSIIIILTVMFIGLLFLKDDEVKITLTSDEIKLKENYEKYNNIEYNDILLNEVNIIDDNNVIYANSENIKNILTKGTNIVFFGNEHENVSRSILPILISFLKNNNIEQFYYYDSINIKKDSSYRNIISILKKDTDDKNIAIPTIVFIKNDKIIGIYENDEYNKEEIEEKLTYYLGKINPSVCSTEERC